MIPPKPAARENAPLIDFGACFSPCRTWRYSLWRRWSESGGTVAFIGLNPSTADETHDDPMVRRCIGFARRWGFGRVIMLNAFGYRSTDPRKLRDIVDPVGPGNDAAIRAICRRAGLIVACWGIHGALFDRELAIHKLLHNRSLFCFGTTAGGQPKHPLYLRSTERPIPFAPVGRRQCVVPSGWKA